MFGNKMVTPAIPERVYVLCKTIHASSGQHIKKDDLKQLMEPTYVKNNSSYFNDYFFAAEELGLITIIDGTVTLAIDWDSITTINSFRRYVNYKLKDFSSGHFYKVTKAYFSLGTSVLSGNKNISVDSWRKLLGEQFGITVDAPEMRAWRFWFSFLGFGYMHDMFPIPNAAVFIRDLIEIINIERGKQYLFDDFINLLKPDINIVTETNNRELSFGASCGFHSLNDLGVVNLQEIMDQYKWSIYSNELKTKLNNVSHITVND